MPRQVRADHISTLVQGGRLAPDDLVMICLDDDDAPSAQTMDTVIAGDGCCCVMRYEVTETALVTITPVCICCPCFGTYTSHYDLVQVQDMHHRRCCGSICSRLTVDLDNNESIVIKCVDTNKFVTALHSRISRTRVTRK